MQTVMKATIAEDTAEVFGKPTVTPLDDKELTIKEEHMEEVISKGVDVFNDGPNGMPDPEKDPKDDDDETSSSKAKMKEAMKEVEKVVIDKDNKNLNMEVGLQAIHLISPEARK
jgi:hypothetical protein|tara:strand:+ start:121 stop:462 length:342 start_codon:yes stop_codon:yes gene_type:complete